MSACEGRAFIVLKYPLLQCLVTHIWQKEDYNFHNEIWSLIKSPLQRKKKKTKCIFTVFNRIFVRVQRSTEHQSEVSSEVIYTTLKICSFLLSLLLISLHLLVLLIM